MFAFFLEWNENFEKIDDDLVMPLNYTFDYGKTIFILSLVGWSGVILARGNSDHWTFRPVVIAAVNLFFNHTCGTTRCLSPENFIKKYLKLRDKLINLFINLLINKK